VLRLGRTRQPPPAIPVGTSADLKVGQATFAIGNPFGLDQTLTTGVISALKRRLPTSEGREIADISRRMPPSIPAIRRAAARFRGPAHRRQHGDLLACRGLRRASASIPVDVVNRVAGTHPQRARADGGDRHHRARRRPPAQLGIRAS
jgi:hypothetical protein